MRLILIHNAKLSLEFGEFSTDPFKNFYGCLLFRWMLLLLLLYWCWLMRKVFVRYRGRWAATSARSRGSVVIQQRNSGSTAERGRGGGSGERSRSIEWNSRFVLKQ